MLSDLEEPERTLNVRISASTYWHIRDCANQSRMSVKDFMERFGKLATPFPLNLSAEEENVKGQPGKESPDLSR